MSLSGGRYLSIACVSHLRFHTDTVFIPMVRWFTTINEQELRVHCQFLETFS
jgi:hypothetical protein